MRSLRKTALLGIVASVLLVAALLRSWTPRAYTYVDVRQRPASEAERLLEERLADGEQRYADIPYRVKESVAGSVDRWGRHNWVCLGWGRLT